VPTDRFHRQPFDEGTLTKLEVLELYAREWLPVFLAQERSRWNEIHIFDFFAGPGTDARGTLGSPLRLLKQIDATRGRPGWRYTKVHCHFYDWQFLKIAELRSQIEERVVQPDILLDIDVAEFSEAFDRNRHILSNPFAAKLLFIDQYGVDSVTPQVFRTLVEAPTCDFLFFISSSTLNRFRDHPAIKQKLQDLTTTIMCIALSWSTTVACCRRGSSTTWLRFRSRRARISTV
jgi:three-Cys-motif partner protein